MPTYVYECTKCGEVIEVFQRMDEAPIENCGSCEGAVKKVFTPVGIVFKGSGFYCNDNKKSGVIPSKSETKTKCEAAASGASSACSGCDKAAPASAD